MSIGIVILGADCIQCGYVNRSLKTLAIDVFYVSETGNLPFFLNKRSNIVIRYAPNNGALEYLKKINEIASQYNILYIYSLSEPGFEFLYNIRDRVDKNCEILFPSKYTDYLSVSNKWELTNVAHLNCIDVLPTYLSTDMHVIAEEHNFSEYKLIRKPNIGSGARGFKIISDLEQLLEVTVSPDYHLQPFVEVNRQFKCTALSLKGQIVHIGAIEKNRYFPSEGGSLTAGSCIVPDQVFLKVLGKLCSYTNWTGVIDTDFIFDVKTSTYYLLEVNPRMPACMKYCDYLGVDFFSDLLLYELESRSSLFLVLDCVNNKPPIKNLQVRYLTLDVLLLCEYVYKFKFKKAFYILVELFVKKNNIDIYHNNYINFLKVILIQLRKMTSIKFILQKFR